MRISHRLLLSILLLLTAGCSATKDVSYLTPMLDATPAPEQPSDLVATELDAITLGSKLLEGNGSFQWIDTPSTIFAKEMIYTEAVQLIGEGIAEYELWPGETKVWVVVFKGQWQLTPLDPNQENPQPVNYEGCVYALFTARNGELIATGDAICPAN